MRRFVDVSSNNHPGAAPIDWERVKATGIEGVLLKLTESTTYANPYAVGDTVGALDAGLEVGFYHFARPTETPAASQAAFFASHIGSSLARARTALDLEDGDQIGWPRLAAWVQEFVSAVRTDELYVDDYYRRGLGSTGAGLLVRTWAAEPGATAIPAGFDAVQTGQEAVDGIVGLVDVDLVGWPPVLV